MWDGVDLNDVAFRLDEARRIECDAPKLLLPTCPTDELARLLPVADIKRPVLESGVQSSSSCSTGRATAKSGRTARPRLRCGLFPTCPEIVGNPAADDDEPLPPRDSLATIARFIPRYMSRDDLSLTTCEIGFRLELHLRCALVFEFLLLPLTTGELSTRLAANDAEEELSLTRYTPPQYSSSRQSMIA